MSLTRNGIGRETARARLRSAGMLVVAVAAGTAALAGCKAHKPYELPPDPPYVADEAMQYRQWPQTPATMPSLATETYASRWPYDPERSMANSELASYFVDTAAFLYQSVRLPFTFLVKRPFTKETYRELDFQPTYTAMPALPPERGAQGPQGESAPGEAAPGTETPGNAPPTEGAMPGEASPQPGTATPSGVDNGVNSSGESARPQVGPDARPEAAPTGRREAGPGNEGGLSTPGGEGNPADRDQTGRSSDPSRNPGGTGTGSPGGAPPSGGSGGSSSGSGGSGGAGGGGR